MMQTWLMNEAASPPAVRQEPDNTLHLLDVDFWLWYQKVTPKGMAHAFRIRFWETFSTPRTYDILTDNQYKLPNSNDGCMRLRAPTTCPKWNKGTDKDVIILHWLSKNAGLTSECITEVIEPFARQQLENVTVRATLKHHGGYTVTQGDRGENQREKSKVSPLPVSPYYTTLSCTRTHYLVHVCMQAISHLW